MMRALNVTGRAARGATVVVAALAVGLTFALPAAAQTQAPESAAAPLADQAPRGPRPVSESVAAVVNDEIISTYDLGQRMRLLIVTSGLQPTEQTLPQIQQDALISLVDERLQIQELRRVEKDQKISIIGTDEEVAEEVNVMAQSNNMKADAFLAALRAQGISKETLYDQIRAQMSWQRWIRGRYGSRLRVGEDQIKATQTRLIAAAAKPQYRVSEVFIDSNRAGSAAAAVQGATQLVAQLQQGAPFAAVAKQFSASPTAATGGDAGWIGLGEMPSEVDAVLDQLRPGQLSAPIPVKDGAYIIYLRDKRSGAGQSLVSLKQVAVALPATASAADVEAARAKLEAVRTQITGCDTVESAAGKTPGVVAGDLGEAEITDLSPEFKDAAQGLAIGQVSEPIRTKVGLHLLAVCGKRSAGETQLSHDEIENRLTGQQLGMIARRYMRDLQNSATIETK